MHIGFVRVDEQKMSKSLGNFFLIRDILERFDAEVVRFFILRAHYRSPLNYSDLHLEDARQALSRLYTALRGAPAAGSRIDWGEAHARRFRDAMDDDFGTPEAVAVLFELANEINRGRTEFAPLLRALGGLLGLLQRDAQAFLQAGPAVRLADAEISERIEARIAARKAKNFTEADRIRKELEAGGVVLEDGPAGTTWRRA
jgi:cysteinyl-tRNA synthetase